MLKVHRHILHAGCTPRKQQHCGAHATAIQLYATQRVLQHVVGQVHSPQCIHMQLRACIVPDSAQAAGAATN